MIRSKVGWAAVFLSGESGRVVLSGVTNEKAEKSLSSQLASAFLVFWPS